MTLDFAKLIIKKMPWMQIVFDSSYNKYDVMDSRNLPDRDKQKPYLIPIFKKKF